MVGGAMRASAGAAVQAASSRQQPAHLQAAGPHREDGEAPQRGQHPVALAVHRLLLQLLLPPAAWRGQLDTHVEVKDAEVGKGREGAGKRGHVAGHHRELLQRGEARQDLCGVRVRASAGKCGSKRGEGGGEGVREQGLGDKV